MAQQTWSMVSFQEQDLQLNIVHLMLSLMPGFWNSFFVFLFLLCLFLFLTCALNDNNYFKSIFLDARIEEFVYEKLDRKAPSRMNNPELLGQYMIDAGNEFGPGTAYGKK